MQQIYFHHLHSEHAPRESVSYLDIIVYCLADHDAWQKAENFLPDFFSHHGLAFKLRSRYPAFRDITGVGFHGHTASTALSGRT